MLWSSNDESNDQGGDPLDENYDQSDLSPEAMAIIKDDCEKFLDLAENTIDLDRFELGCLGHDFWLTRNHHGAGFWDGDYPEDVGKVLTELSHKFGEINPIVGDDGKIYLE